MQTAGISYSDVTVKKEEVGIYDVAQANVHVDDDGDFVDKIAEKVAQKLSGLSMENDVSNKQSVNYVRPFQGSRGRRNNQRGSRRQFSANNSRDEVKRGGYNCRNCRSSSHGYAKCPTRFCQACGHRGHDAWNRDCPNYN